MEKLIWQMYERTAKLNSANDVYTCTHEVLDQDQSTKL